MVLPKAQASSTTSTASCYYSCTATRCLILFVSLVIFALIGYQKDKLVMEKYADDPVELTTKRKPSTSSSSPKASNIISISDDGRIVYKRPDNFIRYQLHGDREAVFNNLYAIKNCQGDRNENREHLWEPKEMYTTPGLFDFGVTVETDLSILFMGDSIGIQLAHAFEEASGYGVYDYDSKREYYKPYIINGIYGPTKGGGIVSAYRITGMFLNEGKEGARAPNRPVGGWVERDVNLTNAWLDEGRDLSLDEGPDFDPETTTRTIVNHTHFEVMVFRVPIGWINYTDVTESTILETVELANQYFGVRSMIMTTLPMHNNFHTPYDLEQAKLRDDMIMKFAREWNVKHRHERNDPDATGVHTILVLNWSRYAAELAGMNAQLLGLIDKPIDEITLEDSEQVFMNHRIDIHRFHEFPTSSVAQICSRPLDPETQDCKRNFLSLDGMHWCMETSGPRINAVNACLLTCIYPPAETDESANFDLEACADECNDRFMSIRPVLDEELDTPRVPKASKANAKAASTPEPTPEPTPRLQSKSNSNPRKQPTVDDTPYEDVLSDDGTTIYRTPKQFFHYTLHRNQSEVYTNIYGQKKCDGDKNENRVREWKPEAFYNTPAMFDFGVTVETDLAILFMGDSISMQLSHAFEEAAGYGVYDHWDRRRVYRPKIQQAHYSPAKGGGVVACFRVTHLFLNAMRGKPRAPARPVGGWQEDDLEIFKGFIEHDRNLTEDEGPDAASTTNGGPSIMMKHTNYDVVIYRVPIGWINYTDIDEARVAETVQLVNEHFGARTMIFTTLPMHNNFHTHYDLEEAKARDDMIKAFASKWTQEHRHERNDPDATGVHTILVLDWTRYTAQLIGWNAQLMGLIDKPADQVTLEDAENVFVDNRLAYTRRFEYGSSSEPMVCSSPKEQRDSGTVDCLRNYWSVDGMHWCMETMGGRLIAINACLLSCLYPNAEPANYDVEACAADCNDRFMTLRPVSDQEFVNVNDFPPIKSTWQ